MKPIHIIQNWEAESPGVIVDYLDEKGLPYQITKTHRYEPLPAVSDIETAILLGCPHSVCNYRDYDFLIPVHDFVVETVRADRSLLAICFGAQMLAMVLGAEVTRNPVKEIGMHTVRLTDEGLTDPLLAGFEQEFEVFQWHADTFSIPQGAAHLATSDICCNQAFRLGNFVGVQFHPEPRPDEVPVWCDVFRQELAEEGLNKADIVAEFEARANRLKAHTYRFLDNFLG